MSIIRIRPKTVRAIYLCPVCHTAYTTEDEALVCATQPLVSKFKPGDMVVVHEGYGWATNPEWIAEDAGKFHDKNTHNFYFIVTAITPDLGHLYEFEDNRRAHRALIHVATGGANISEKGEHAGFRLGWTTDDGRHRGIKLAPKCPPALYEAAKHLIGQTGDLL